jgi:hypothetical protein
MQGSDTRDWDRRPGYSHSRAYCIRPPAALMISIFAGLAAPVLRI